MKHVRTIGWLILLAIAAGAIWYYFFPSPEREIENRLKKLSAAISADVSHSNIKKVANANRILGFFTPDVSIQTEGFSRYVESLNGRDELLQAIMAGRSNAGKISAEFYNINIVVDPGGETANVTMSVIVRLPEQSEPMAGEVKLDFKKIDRSWLISHIEPIKGQIK